ncbi:MAG: hypothetical protein IJK72_01400 [Mycoplasma sp.]|nr:hypothetical protein [Mycoplasma sp.]
MKMNKNFKTKTLIWFIYVYLTLEIICFSLSAIFGTILLPLAVSWKSIECIMCFSTFSIGFFAMAIAWFCLTFKYKKQLAIYGDGFHNTFNKKKFIEKVDTCTSMLDDLVHCDEIAKDKQLDKFIGHIADEMNELRDWIGDK